jgi:hypothetical protein
VSTADQYRIRAAELRAKAHEERNPRLAAEYEHLAKSYIRLAEQADRNQKLDVTYEPSPPMIPKGE